MMAQNSKLKRSTIMYYALPALPISALGLPLVVHLPPFYAETTGLGLGLIGLIFMVLRLWDVITDPVMGWAADKFEMIGGKRRGWIILSVPILMISTWMVFNPPEGASWQYLALWLMILYVGFTMLSISHLSWGAELSPQYHDRSRVHAIREAFLIIGMLGVLALPVWVDYSSGSALGRLESAKVAVSVMGLFIVVILPLSIFLAVAKVGERKRKPPQVSWRETFRAFSKNKPLRFLMSADLALSFSAGAVSSMFFFLTLDVLALDRLASDIMLLCYFGMGVICVPLLLKIAGSIGKHRTQFFSSFFSFITLPIILFVPKGDASFAFVAWMLLGVNMAAGAVLMRSMVADVCDIDEVETGIGASRMGMFYALLTLTAKLGYALAIGILYSVLAYLGYKRGGANSDEVLLQVRQLYVFVPMLMNALVMIFMYFYPLDRAAQEKTRNIIESHGQT
jgi:Na+/melibiose symporter-like transporter